MMIYFGLFFQATKLRKKSQLEAIFTEINLLSAVKRFYKKNFCRKCLPFQIIYVTLHTQSVYKAKYEN